LFQPVRVKLILDNKRGLKAFGLSEKNENRMVYKSPFDRIFMQKKRKNNKSVNCGTSRRAFIATALLGAGVIGAGALFNGSYWVRKFNGNPNFEDAKSDYTCRQMFLDRLLINDKIPFCDGVVYDHKGNMLFDWYEKEMKFAGKKMTDVDHLLGGEKTAFENGNYDVKTPDILNLSGEGRHTKIFVGRQPFESPEFKLFNAEDWRNVIVNHEARHVRQYSQGLKYLPRDEVLTGLKTGEITEKVVYFLGEYDSLSHEMRAALEGRKGLTQAYLEDTGRKLTQTYEFLKKEQQTSSHLQSRIISQAISKNSKIICLEKMGN